MGNFIVIVILLAIFIGAVTKLSLDKKNGVKCSGCPYSKSCCSKDSCSSIK